MKQLKNFRIRFAFGCLLLLLLTSYNNCSNSVGFKSLSLSAANVNNSKSLSSSAASTIYKITYSDVYHTLNSSEIYPISRHLDSNGNIIQLGSDYKETVIAKLNPEMIQKILLQISKIEEVNYYILAPADTEDDYRPAVCREYYRHELYINGATIKTEEQIYCGAQLILRRPCELNNGVCTLAIPSGQDLRQMEIALADLLKGVSWVTNF